MTTLRKQYQALLELRVKVAQEELHALLYPFDRVAASDPNASLLTGEIDYADIQAGGDGKVYATSVEEAARLRADQGPWVTPRSLRKVDASLMSFNKATERMRKAGVLADVSDETLEEVWNRWRDSL